MQFLQTVEWLRWNILLSFKKHFNKNWKWFMPNWTCFHAIISQEVTGISVALAFFGAQTSVCLLTACLNCDISLLSLGCQLCETTIQYILQCISSFNLAGLIFFYSLLLPLSVFVPFSPLFLFSPFSWSPSLRPRTQHFPTECTAEGWAFVSCYRETWWEEEAGWLPGCQLGVYVSVRKSRGDRSDDDRTTVYPRDWLQLKNI